MGNQKGSCCSKGDNSFEEHFKPQANSSFLETNEAHFKPPANSSFQMRNETLFKPPANSSFQMRNETLFKPQVNSTFLETNEASILSDEDIEEMDNTFSSIYSARGNKSQEEPEEKLPACCMNKSRPIERKIMDASITSSPIPTRGGSYSASKSFANSFNDTYRSTGGGNYTMASADRDSRLNDTSRSARSHVPRASRNYHTYDDMKPQYYSTPKPTAYQSWKRFRDAQDIIRPPETSSTNGTPIINTVYRNPSIQEPYTPSYVQSPYVSPYRQAVPQASVVRRTWQRPQPQSPLSRLADPDMSSFRERRPTPIPQRRYPQTSTPYERPHSAVVPSGQSELPACCRPKTAEASVERSAGCANNSCGKKNEPKEGGGSCSDGTCSKQNLVSSNTQTCPAKASVGCQSAGSKPNKCGGGCDQGDEEELLDTLLEIRTPHRAPGSTSGMPFVLSINVSCAERSINERPIHRVIPLSQTNMADYCSYTARSSRGEMEGTFTRPNNPRNVNAPTIVIHPPSLRMEEDEYPGCCEPQDLPIYRRVKDPTVTSAPPRQEAQESCPCIDQTNQGVLRKYRGYDDLRSRQELSPPSVMQRTRNISPNLGGTFVGSRGNVQGSFHPSHESSAIQSTFGATRDVTPPHMRDRRYDTVVTPPVGFEQFSQFGNTFDQPPFNSTYNRTSSYPTQTTSGSDFLTSGEYSDQGPWRNFAIPKKLKRVNIAPGAHKTYPRSAVPLPSRNYSTYNDKQPILDVPEVTAHRKKAPRFYSTPTASGVIDDGTGISSVWGQELNPSSGSYTDSSAGWSQGVRMDSYNVYGQITPSPKNVQVPPRYTATQILSTKQPSRIPAAHATHTYLQNPYPNVPNIMYPSTESSRMPGVGSNLNATRSIQRGASNRTVTIPSAGASNRTVTRPSAGASNRTVTRPSAGALNRTVTIPPEEEEGFCEPCATGASSCLEDEEADKKKDEEAAKKKGEGKDIEKDFCTVLEIRTPCANSAPKPDKPLNLSIHVTCIDPTYLVTPDKRFNVIGHDSTPKVQPTVEPQIEEVPSDCQCEA